MFKKGWVNFLAVESACDPEKSPKLPLNRETISASVDDALFQGCQN